jgi:hypothetical protein
MSRRTKLIILALFLVLLAIPAACVALTWSPDDTLRFRIDHLVPPSTEHPDAYRKLRVSIENTSSAPVHFYGAAMTDESAYDVLPKPRYSKVVVARDLMCGAVSTQLLKEDVPFESAHRIILPAFLILDTSVGEPLIIPAHSTVHVPAILPAYLVDSAPPCDIFVHAVCETQTRVTARNISGWLREHSPTRARNLFPQLPHRQDTTVLQGLRK